MAHDEKSTPPSPWDYVAGAVGLALVVGLAVALEWPSWVVAFIAAVAGLVATIGAVAAGVMIGIRRADHLRDQP